MGILDLFRKDRTHESNGYEARFDQMERDVHKLTETINTLLLGLATEGVKREVPVPEHIAGAEEPPQTLHLATSSLKRKKKPYTKPALNLKVRANLETGLITWKIGTTFGRSLAKYILKQNINLSMVSDRIGWKHSTSMTNVIYGRDRFPPIRTKPLLEVTGWEYSWTKRVIDEHNTAVAENKGIKTAVKNFTKTAK